MPTNQPISDHEVRERLAAAERALGDEPCETEVGRNALDAARKALRLLSAGVLKSGLDKDPKNGR